MTAGTRSAADAGATAEFERIYRANVEAVTAYFARRSADPHVVADLTADTFVAVITHFASFDPRKGTARAWVFGIARRVYASHCEAYSQQLHKMQRLAGRRELDQDQVEELLDRIDAERAGRDLLSELATRSGVKGMTKFADQLYTDLIREHGSTLADTRPPAGSPRQFASRRVLLAAGAGGAAVAATAGVLTAGGGSPAYALTTNQDGTVTLAVYQESGIAQANARLHQLRDRVVVVPVRPGCPSIHSLPPPAVRPAHKSSMTMMSAKSRDGSIKVRASGIPAGDILVVGIEVSADSSAGEAALTAPPAPSCVSPPPAPPSGK